MTFADYSAGRPSGANLRAHGITGVVRYIGMGGTKKRLTAAEYADLRAAGITVWFVFEGNTTDAAGGYAAGYANGLAALAALRTLGITDTTSPIFCAADGHAPEAGSVASMVDYARGTADAVGKARAGFYGFSEGVEAAHRAGVVSAYWLAGSHPSAALAAYIHLWQDNSAAGSVTIDGIAVDLNRVFNAFAPTPEDDEMALTDKLPPVTLNDGNEYTLTVGDVLRGLAQYISGDAAEGGTTTAHPAGQYVTRILKTDAILTAVEKIPTAPAPVEVVLTADQIAAITAGIPAAVRAAVSGLSLAVSPVDRAAIAQAAADATAREFATRLGA